MKTLVRTTDPMLVSAIESLLADERIAVFVFDVNTSIIEGGIGVLPRRVMVADDEYSRARRILEDAGLSDELEQPEPPAPKRKGFFARWLKR